MSNEKSHRSIIGQIQGLNKVPGVNQYLGIQYAALKDRFSRGELIETYPHDGILDGTKLGYVAPGFQGSQSLSLTTPTWN